MPTTSKCLRPSPSLCLPPPQHKHSAATSHGGGARQDTHGNRAGTYTKGMEQMARRKGGGGTAALLCHHSSSSTPQPCPRVCMHTRSNASAPASSTSRRWARSAPANGPRWRRPGSSTTRGRSGCCVTSTRRTCGLGCATSARASSAWTPGVCVLGRDQYNRFELVDGPTDGGCPYGRFHPSDPIPHVHLHAHTHSRPWLCYWMLHSLDLLQGVQPKAGNEELLRGVVGA
jgi:hypothetical protein